MHPSPKLGRQIAPLKMVIQLDPSPQLRSLEETTTDNSVPGLECELAHLHFGVRSF